MIGPTVVADRRDDPEWHAEERCVDHGERGQLECCGNKVLEVFGDWIAGHDRLAHVAAKEILHVVDVLDGQRPIQSPSPFERCSDFRTVGLAFADQRRQRDRPGRRGPG